MFGKMFGNRPTNRADVAMAVTAAILAIFKAWDTTKDYKQTQEAKENKA